jgi:aldose 1-epimerase
MYKETNMMNLWCVLLVVACVALNGCSKSGEVKEDDSTDTSQIEKGEDMSGAKELFGKMPDGREVYAYTLKNKHGSKARFIEYGGTLVSLDMPDRNGAMVDVVLGFNTLEDYLKKSPFFGCITGRFANRIAKGRFTLNGQSYVLAANNGPNHLHGGEQGFDKRLWEAEVGETEKGPFITFHDVSPDGDQGYPGALTSKVTYTLGHDNSLSIDYLAETDKPTIVNLTHHSYFNLAGEGRGNILDHQLTLHCSNYTPIDETSIPLGSIEPVKGTPFDFTMGHTIGARINDSHEQIQRGQGYDHNMVIDGQPGEMRPVAEVYEPQRGIVLTVRSDQPGVQFYTGNFLDGSAQGKSGVAYSRRTGFCLETQNFPDAPNQPDFPSPVLNPGQPYVHRVEYVFSTR